MGEGLLPTNLSRNATLYQGQVMPSPPFALSSRQETFVGLKIVSDLVEFRPMLLESRLASHPFNLHCGQQADSLKRP